VCVCVCVCVCVWGLLFRCYLGKHVLRWCKCLDSCGLDKRLAFLKEICGFLFVLGRTDFSFVSVLVCVTVGRQIVSRLMILCVVLGEAYVRNAFSAVDLTSAQFFANASMVFTCVVLEATYFSYVSRLRCVAFCRFV
jgi:hypothetical protein